MLPDRLPVGITRFRGFKPGPVFEEYPLVEQYAYMMETMWENYRAIELSMALALYGVPKRVVWNVQAQ